MKPVVALISGKDTFEKTTKLLTSKMARSNRFHVSSIKISNKQPRLFVSEACHRLALIEG